VTGITQGSNPGSQITVRASQARQQKEGKTTGLKPESLFALLRARLKVVP
jgi:hypothetical protein